MSWSNPTTRQTGDLITAAIWNQDVVDNPTYLHDNFPTRALMWHVVSKVTAGNALTHLVQTGHIFYTYSAQSSPANGDTFTQSFVLAAGTYTFRVLGVTSSNNGRIDWYVDNVLIVSGQDWYSASATCNVIQSQTNVSIVGSGRHVLKGMVNGKNASSSSYQIPLTAFWFEPASDVAGV